MLASFGRGQGFSADAGDVGKQRSFDERQHLAKAWMVSAAEPLEHNHLGGDDFGAVAFHSP
jgi:hypothetical protein